jgi:FkbM family methyltransferase
MRLSPLLPPLGPLKVVDVGAMMFADAGDAYERLRQSVPCQVVGFEPVTAECDKLNERKRPGDVYLPYVIGDGSTRTFYECNFSMTSSLFEPNAPLLDKFQNLNEQTQVVRTSRVETRRLDDLPETAGVDYLKLDVQGAEILVLQGAEARLADALVVHTEVLFVELYRGQALFGDIDAFLRARGFVLHQLSQTGRAFKPVIVNDNINGPGSQVLWGDAVYVRDFMTLEGLSPEKLLKLALILDVNYGSIDYVTFALGVHDRLTGTSLRAAYMKALASSA